MKSELEYQIRRVLFVIVWAMILYMGAQSLFGG